MPSIYPCIFARTVALLWLKGDAYLGTNGGTEGRMEKGEAEEANNLQDRVSSGYKCDCNSSPNIFSPCITPPPCVSRPHKYIQRIELEGNGPMDEWATREMRNKLVMLYFECFPITAT